MLIATHNGAFHADDIFGVAVLLLLHPHAELVRTRDPLVISKANFAVDVGGQWDPRQGRFDHHQKGFSGARENGTVFASAGLVWASHGVEALHKVVPGANLHHLRKLYELIDVELVEHIDRADTGADIGAPGCFGLSAQLWALNLTRLEEEAIRSQSSEADVKTALANARVERFMVGVQLVQALIRRMTAQFYSELLDQDLVRASSTVEQGRILVLDKSGLSWEQVVIDEMPDVLFVVYPDSTDQQYQVRTVPVAKQSFTARKDLPKAWAGLRDADLAQVTGVKDSVFCHNACFIGGAGSKEGAIALAKLAL